MRYMFILIALIISSAAYAAMTSITINIASGDTKNLVSCVQWPVDAATAKFNPPAKVNGELSTFISFCVSSKVIVEGPTTVTLEYGTPEVAPESTPEQ